MLVANGRGYPNVGEKIGDPAFETITGMAFSSGGAVWLGVAVADWLSVSFGVLGGSFRKSGRDASLAAFQFRMEAFPLYSLGGAWRDVGVLASSGVGQFQVENAGDQLVDGGGASAVGLGAFYEPIRWAGFAMGPQFEYTAQFAENLSAYALILGWRTAFYADP